MHELLTPEKPAIENSAGGEARASAPSPLIPRVPLALFGCGMSLEQPPVTRHACKADIMACCYYLELRLLLLLYFTNMQM